MVGHWATSPQAESFLATDWRRLILLAALVERYVCDPKATTLSEIRINEASLGATARDRQALRMVIAAKEEKAATDSAPGLSARDRYMRPAYGQGSDLDNVARLRAAFDQNNEAADDAEGAG